MRQNTCIFATKMLLFDKRIQNTSIQRHKRVFKHQKRGIKMKKFSLLVVFVMAFSLFPITVAGNEPTLDDEFIDDYAQYEDLYLGYASDYDITEEYTYYEEYNYVADEDYSVAMQLASPLNITRPGAISRFSDVSAVSVNEGIRIEEAAPGVFPHWNYLFVNLEILSEGFYWDNNNPTISSAPSSHLSVNVFNEPSQSQSARAYQSNDIMAFTVEVNRQGHGAHQATWFQIDNLYISSSYRAQVGNVNVRVRVAFVYEDSWALLDAGTVTAAIFDEFYYEDTITQIVYVPEYITDIDLQEEEIEEEYPVEAEQKTTQIRLAISHTLHHVNGVPVEGEYAPFIDLEYNRTMVPLRLISEALGAQIDWCAAARTVIITIDGQTLLLHVDTSLSEGMGMPSIVDNRTFVPVNYIAQVLGFNTTWDRDAGAVYISN